MISFNELNIIGITGISGAGKSEAARVFAENGFCAINCDEAARKIIIGVRPGEAVRKAFPEAFTDGKFDRLKTARFVFSDERKLKAYENIVFPYIIYGLIKYILDEAERGKRDFVLDAPTLYQSGADDLCKKIIAVAADKTSCVKRITARDNMSEKDALLRISSQPEADFFKARADYFIENDGDAESFKAKITELIHKL